MAKKCKECKGTGEIECPNCYGTGIDATSDSESARPQCHDCHGEGDIQCTECDGKGTV